MTEGDWVSASVARDMLKAATGMEPAVLVRWAAIGALRSRAEMWQRDWREEVKNVDLPKEFWLGAPVTEAGIQLEEFTLRDWDSGIFFSLVNEPDENRHLGGQSPFQHAAQFVEFLGEDLKRCIAKLNNRPRQRLTEPKPRLPDAALTAWFVGLGSDAEKESQIKLMELCRKAHPNYAITRERIRVKTPGRDRGPKPHSR